MVEPFESSSRHALITRPREDGAAVAAAVMRRGVMPVISPVMTVEQLDIEIDRDVDRCQAVLFTSGNGVRAFCRLSDRRDKHAYAVGSATAALARDSGFALVTSADGNSSDLARMVAASLSAYDGPLFHAAGTTVAGDLSRQLDEAGFETVRRTLYAARPVDRLPPEAETALREDRLDYVLLFSPRTAKVFGGLVEAAGLALALGRVAAVCLSEAVADELDDESWKEIRVADRPTLEAMVEAVDDAAAGTAGPEDAGTGQPTAPPADAAPEPEIEIIVPEDAAGRPGSGGTDGGPDAGGMPGAAPWGSRGRSAAGGPVSGTGAGSPDTPPGTDGGPGPTGPASPTTAAPRGGYFSRRAAIAAGAVAVVVAVAFGYLAWSLWQTRATGQEVRALVTLGESQRADLARLAEQRNAELARLDGERRAELAGLREERALLAREVAGLKDRLAAAEARLADADGLVARLDALEKADRASDGSAAAAAVDGLAERIDGVENRLAEAEKARVAAEERQRTGDRTGTELRLELDRAHARIDELGSALKSVQEASGDPPRASPEDAAAELRSELDRANARIDELGSLLKAAQEASGDPARTAAAAAELRSGLDRANARIEELGSLVKSVREVPRDPGRYGVIALAASRLREAMAGPRPFATELAAVENLARGDADIARAIAPLAPHAADGVPSRVLLFDRFPDVVRAVAAAVPEPDVAGDWWDQAVTELRNLVRIRRVDGGGGGVDSILARAETQARRGDLASVVLELSGLEGRPATAAQRWLDEARARLAVESAAAALDYVVLDRLGATGG